MGRAYPFSKFPAHLHLQIHMPTSSLSSYPAALAKSVVTLFRQIVTLRGITLPISYHVYGPFGEHLGRPKIAHGSHNDVRRLCWPNLGCDKPFGVSARWVAYRVRATERIDGASVGLRKPPSGNREGLALLGEPVWAGAFGWGALTGVTVEGW